MVRNILQEQVDWESYESNEKAVKPLGSSKPVLMDRYKSAKQLSTKNLDNDNNSPDDDESWIGKDSFKDIDLVSNLSGTDHVENLHENDKVENNGKVS